MSLSSLAPPSKNPRSTPGTGVIPENWCAANITPLFKQGKELTLHWYDLNITTVWSPHLINDKNMLEKVQKCAARYVKGEYTYDASVTEMHNEFNWLRLRITMTPTTYLGLPPMLGKGLLVTARPRPPQRLT